MCFLSVQPHGPSPVLPLPNRLPSAFNWKGEAAELTQHWDRSCGHWERISISIASDWPVHNDNLELWPLGENHKHIHSPTHTLPLSPLHRQSRKQASAMQPQRWAAQLSVGERRGATVAAVRLKSVCNELEFHWSGLRVQNRGLFVPEGLPQCCSVAPHKCLRGPSCSRVMLPGFRFTITTHTCPGWCRRWTDGRLKLVVALIDRSFF